MPNTFPEMPLDAWRPTKNTLHLYCQIVGKIRLAMHPRLNHWWHVPLYVSPRGLTTRAIPYRGGNFEIEFDFQEHALKIYTSDGRIEDFALYDGLTVADFYSSLFSNRAKDPRKSVRSSVDDSVFREHGEQVLRQDLRRTLPQDPCRRR